MPDGEKSKSSFSETYWNLHRNSLLFSTALLVFSLPHVTLNPDQQFLIFSVKEIAETTVLAGLALVATYALAAYYLEWRHEASVQLGDHRNLLRNAVTQADVTISLVKRQVEQAEVVRREATDHLQRAENLIGKIGENFHRFIEDDPAKDRSRLWRLHRDARGELDRALITYMKRITIDPLLFGRLKNGDALSIDHNDEDRSHPDQSRSERWDKRLPPIEGVDEAIDQLITDLWAEKIADKALPELNSVSNEFRAYRESEGRSADAVRAIVSPLQAHISTMEGLRHLFKKEMRLETMRVRVLGVGLPATLYVVALGLAVYKVISPII